ncbi:MAG TPA: MEDS domain-containing protein [Candidatus Limnocylindrales bacterium]|nr:MEDS domain-containing protein [Candidatus Limnocylindrales bacterium]
MTTVPLGFGNREVPVPSHLCVFYYDDDELRSRFGFLRAGLEASDEAVVLFGTPERLEQITGYLAKDLRRDIAADLASGKLVLVGGAVDPDQLLGGIGEALTALKAKGIRLIRFMGFIGWGDERWPNMQQLLAFEATVNEAAAQFPAVVACTYNVNQLPGAILMMGGIATHPLTVFGSTLCENPHYVSTSEYLAELETAGGRAWWEGVRVGPVDRAAAPRRVSERAVATGRD